MRVRCGVIARVHAVQNGVRLDDQWDFERNPPLVAGRRVAKQGGFPLKGHNFGQNVAKQGGFPLRGGGSLQEDRPPPVVPYIELKSNNRLCIVWNMFF